jgi:hypothetical protein
MHTIGVGNQHNCSTWRCSVFSCSLVLQLAAADNLTQWLLLSIWQPRR